MDRVHYSGHSILTGTAIAHALLDYAQALSQAGASATIEIPTLTPEGVVGRSEILIGPASQLISDAEPSAHPEVTSPDLVAFMREQAARVRALGAYPVSTAAAPKGQSLAGPDYDS